MKLKTTLRLFLTLAASSVLAISSAQAADGTWTQTATTQGDPAGPLTWSETNNWQDGSVAGGTNATAFFTQTASAAQTVALDTDVTLGNLTLNRNQNLTIVPNALDPKILTLDVTTGTPLFSIGGGRLLRIDSVIAGSDGLEITGGGTAGSGVVLTGANTFTGGILLNNGTLGINQNFTNQAGLNGNHITVTGTSYAAFTGGTQITGGVEIPAGSQFRSGTNNSSFSVTGVLSGSGTLTHHQHGAGNQVITLPNLNNTFTGRIDYDMPREATTIVNSLGDAEGSGNIRFGLAGTPTQTHRHHRFEFGSGGEANLVFNHRQFELLGTFENYVIRSNNANHAFVINTDLINSNTRASAILKFEGSGTQTNTFSGNITDGPGNGTDPSVLSINKLNGGTWIFSGINTYTGNTVIDAGTLVVNGDQSSATGPVAVNGTSTLGGSGTIGGSVTVAAGAKIAPGNAAVGTLAIGGDLNISAMAGDAGTLNYELGPIAASDRITVGGGLNIGSGTLGFSDFVFSNVGGLQAGTYTLITSSALSGTLNGADLAGNIGAFDATLQISGNNLVLAVAAGNPTTTLVIDLGAGTQIPGGAFGTFGASNLPIPPLPVGSILRAVEVNTALTATDNSNFASDLAVLFDPTPETPGGDFSVVMTSGEIKFGAPVQLGWAGGNAGPPTPLADTKVAANWAAAGTIDLATTGIFLGNAYDIDINESVQGGTWSGTITLTYDVEATGTPYEDWATGGELFEDDANADGVSDGLAFLLGATGPNVSALDKLPTATQSAGGLVLTFQMLAPAARGGATLALEHSSDLGIGDSWATVAVPATSGTVDDVVFTISGTGPLNVTATIPVSKAASGKLFARLKAVNP